MHLHLSEGSFARKLIGFGVVHLAFCGVLYFLNPQRGDGQAFRAHGGALVQSRPTMRYLIDAALVCALTGQREWWKNPR